MVDPERRPTARDLAGSAVDLHGHATLFRQIARSADKNGNVKVPAAKLLAISEFMDSVVDELLKLIPPEDIDDAST